MKVINDIRYAEHDACFLDLYLPENKRNFTTVLLMHGGGLTGGSYKGSSVEARAEAFARYGIATVSPEYRMFPKAQYPEFIEDAAAAVAWVKREIGKYGGSGRLYVGGFSAGAYLSMMLCFDHRWLDAQGVAPLDIAGYLHGSAQPTKHFNVLKFGGEDSRRLIVDETAPLYHVVPGLAVPPMQILVSDNDVTNRRLQNELLVETMRHMEFDMDKVDFRVLHGTHCSFASEKDAFGNPVFVGMVLEFMRQCCGEDV